MLMAGLGPIMRCVDVAAAIMRAVVDGAVKLCLGCTGGGCFRQARVCGTGALSIYWMACADVPAGGASSGAFFVNAAPGTCLYFDLADPTYPAVGDGGMLLAAADITVIGACDDCRCCTEEGGGTTPRAFYARLDPGTRCACVFLDKPDGTEAMSRISDATMAVLPTILFPIPGDAALFGDQVEEELYAMGPGDTLGDCSGTLSLTDYNLLIELAVAGTTTASGTALIEKNIAGQLPIVASNDTRSVTCPFIMIDGNSCVGGGSAAMGGSLTFTPICTEISVDTSGEDWDVDEDGTPALMVDNTMQTVTIPFTVSGGRGDWLCARHGHIDPFNSQDFLGIWADAGVGTPQNSQRAAHYATGIYPWATQSSAAAGVGAASAVWDLAANGTGNPRTMRFQINDLVLSIRQAA
jgi:hypothetical protein